MGHRLATAVAVTAVFAVHSFGANLPAPQQITPSDDMLSQSWQIRNSTTSGGQILFLGSNDTVYLYDGVVVRTVEATVVGNTVETAVFGLGTGSSAGHVVGGYRRGAGYANVTTDGNPPVTTMLNPEALSITDGCVFMVLQDPPHGAHVFKIDTTTGVATKLSSGDVTVGAVRVISNGCSKAAWTWAPTVTDPVDIQYWNGTLPAPIPATTLATDVRSNPGFALGRIVYTKIVGGIQQVFSIDTGGSLTPVQLSNETDSSKALDRPQTDGRHVAWYRSDFPSGTNGQLILDGGIVFPTGPLSRMNNEFPFQLNRGQLLWKNGSGTHSYDDGKQTFGVDPAPSTTITRPWLTDGYIAFLGLTATGGTDDDVFRITATPPDDASQPSPPLMVIATSGEGVKWDRVSGATSYNAYVALVPGVTKDNYGSLAGGRKITAVTSPFFVTGVPQNTTYYIAITAVEALSEGPSSRVASATFIGDLTWHSVGGLSSSIFYSVAADASNASFVYAGADGSVYKSSNGGINWAPVLTNATTGGTRVAGLAVAGQKVFANVMGQGDIWRTLNGGTNWIRVLDSVGNGLNGSIAIDPVNTNTLYAGDFILPGKTFDHSTIIKSINGGDDWTLTPNGPIPNEEINASAIAIDPGTTSTLYAGANGTPNLAKSIDSAVSWLNRLITGGGAVRSLAIDPTNTSIVYASTFDKGVFKSFDGGSMWTPKNNGLDGVSPTFGGGAGFLSILVDPQDPNLIHLGAGNGYWFSRDGGQNWIPASVGLGGSPYINALTVTPGRRVIAATETGLYMLSFAPPPTVATVSPATGHTGGGSAVTITGTAFQSGAVVTFGGTAATNVVVVNATTITATTPAHSAGAVAVVVTNPDFQSGTLSSAFTYNNGPDVPTGVTALAQSSTVVNVSWNASPGATSYQVYRRAPGIAFIPIGSPVMTTSFMDNVSANTAYLYRVRASNASGTSGDSASDVATTVVFTNEPLAAGVSVQAVHLSQIRIAVNAVRTLAALGAAGFTDAASAGTTVKAVHVTEIRTALTAALGALGLTSGAYTDTSLTGVAIRAVHVQEIRNRVR